jgi:hypothetical protein
MDRMSKLQDALGGIRDEIGVNIGQADTAIRVNDNTREDLRSLREQVNAIYRQLKALEARVRAIMGDP